METVTRHVQLDLTPDALWAAITDRDTLEAWLGERVDVDLRPGGAGVIIDNGVAREVVVQSVEEGRGWTFEWRVEDAPASTVSFEIATTDDGDSVLTITETMEGAGAQAQASVSSLRWELCAILLWACTAAVALVR
jgi:uncharacterized protein YndB with AHSA1/START domain